MTLGQHIAARRKSLGLTQQRLADTLHVSFQAVSKWENDQTMPDISMLAPLARVLRTSVDGLLGFRLTPATEYEKRYQGDAYYWGINPNRLCYDIMQLKPPTQPYRVLDIGCGESKDAVFLARNGYQVTAFDIAANGVEKAQALAQLHAATVDVFRADMLDFEPEGMYDIVFASGALHYLPPEKRAVVIDRLKAHTAPKGLHVMNVFVRKPFIAPPPDAETAESLHTPWVSGELYTLYHDWLLKRTDELIFPCQSGGLPHRHCMNVMIAEKPA